MDSFDGRVAVVTGAAGALGQAVAERAACLGMRLVLADHDAEGLEATSAALQAEGADVLAMVCDVRKGAHVEELADAALIRFHGVHLLFNHAWVAHGCLAWEGSEAEWEDVLGANLWGAIHGLRVFLPLMLECADRNPRYQGHVVNTAPSVGLAGLPLLAANNVTAQAVLALTETLHHDLGLIDAPVGVSVLCADAAAGNLHGPARRRTDGARPSHAPTPGRRAAELLLAQAAAGAEPNPDAQALASLAFDAVRSGRFYVHADPRRAEAAADRMQAFGHAPVPAAPWQSPLDLAQIRATLHAGGSRA
jgi:NAD(P)-dependent dehydrogenase (short-subunit alcohol dehydrogenase family)